MRLSIGDDDWSWHVDVYRVVPTQRALHPSLRVLTISDSGDGQTSVWRGPGERSASLELSLQEIAEIRWVDLLERREDLLCSVSEDEAMAPLEASFGRRRG